MALTGGDHQGGGGGHQASTHLIKTLLTLVQISFWSLALRQNSYMLLVWRTCCSDKNAGIKPIYNKICNNFDYEDDIDLSLFVLLAVYSNDVCIGIDRGESQIGD